MDLNKEPFWLLMGHSNTTSFSKEYKPGGGGGGGGGGARGVEVKAWAS